MVSLRKGRIWSSSVQGGGEACVCKMEMAEQPVGEGKHGVGSGHWEKNAERRRKPGENKDNSMLEVSHTSRKVADIHHYIGSL